MSLDTAIERFRRKQEELFRDEGTVTRLASEGAWNQVTGRYGADTSTEVYDGPCQIRPAEGLVGTDAQVGQKEVRLKDFVLKLPVDTPVREGDTFTCTASEYDADLVSKSFRITDVLRDGRQIARVCVMEEVA